MLILPLFHPSNSNWISYANVPPTILNGGTGYLITSYDWINALNWISEHTPQDAVIAAWWDYGYWITTLGNRSTLADNAANNQTRIVTIAKMLMERPEQATEIANKIKADYIVIYVVAQPVLVDNKTYYILGYGGDESKTPVFMAMAGLDESRYIKDDIYTSEFWNSTFIGKLMPFTRVGYTSFVDGNSTNLSQDYKPGAYSVYSKDIKYPKSIGGGMTNEPLSLVYSSDSFDDNARNMVSAVLIYKVNT